MHRLLLFLVVGCHGIPAPLGPDDVASDSDTAVASDSDTAVTCLSALDDPQAPATWDDVAVLAQVSCVTTQRCDGVATRAAAAVWLDGCFESRAGFYDAGGALFAEALWTDVQTCAPGVFHEWYGEVAGRCNTEFTLRGESPPCALPDEVVVPADGCVADVDLPHPRVADVAPWGGADAYGTIACVGLATCTLGERTLDLVYHDDGCRDGAVDAWDHVTGELVGGLDPEGAAGDCGGPTWVELDLSACLPLTFAPSAACGIVSLL